MLDEEEDTVERIVADHILMSMHQGVGGEEEEDVVRMRKGAGEMQGAGLALQSYDGVHVNVHAYLHTFIRVHT